MKIKEAADKLQLNYSTAKAIYTQYKQSYQLETKFEKSTPCFFEKITENNFSGMKITVESTVGYKKVKETTLDEKGYLKMFNYSFSSTKHDKK